MALQESVSQEADQSDNCEVPPEASLLSRLHRLGVGTRDQVLLCVPNGYADYSAIKAIHDALPRDGIVAEPSLFSLVVSEIPVVVRQPKPRIVLSATDGMLAVKIVVFMVTGVDVQYWKRLKIGDRLNIRAELKYWGGKLQAISPEIVSDQLMGAVLPRYERRRGVVSEQALYDATRYALKHHVEDAARAILRSLPGLDEYRLLAASGLTYPSLASLLKDLHDPKDLDAAQNAASSIRKLAAFSVVFNARRMKERNPNAACALRITRESVVALARKLPMKLTADQRQAIGEVCRDLASPYPMSRLLSGDVGTGKTLCYAIPAIATRSAGHLVAILTPNSVLAEQLASEIQGFFGQGVPVVVVTGSARKRIDLSANPIVVGTTALLSRLKNQGMPPALLVVDEQQKFSVAQKEAVAEAGTNLLEVTATAIPRTTALVTHGGMDVSLLRERPVKKSIQTRILSVGDAERLFSHTLRVLESGSQVAVVYPLVDDAAQEKRSVIRAFEVWARKFPGRVGMVYGAMKEDEKNEVIRKLKAKELSILVSSTVIEIGVTIPDLKSLVVVNADRYGVSTLHQLRGRVARHGGSGYFFIYLPDKVRADTLARLQLLEKYHDGFALAKHDAEIRGYGDLTAGGERQHGASRSSVFKCVELLPEDIHQFSGFVEE